jgi:hypothetical protein
MKKTFTAVMALLFSSSFAIGQTYQPLEDQRLGTGNNVRFKSVSIDSSINLGTSWKISQKGLISHTPSVIATTNNQETSAIDLFPQYKAPGTVTSIPVSAGTTTAVAGTYNNISPSGGSGTGLVVNVTVTSAMVSMFTVVNGGSGYLPQDRITIPRSALGGPATGIFTFPIFEVSAAGSFSSENSVLKMRGYLQNGGITGAFAPFMTMDAQLPTNVSYGRPFQLGMYWANASAAVPAFLTSGVLNMYFSTTGTVTIPTLSSTTTTATTATISSTLTAGQTTSGIYRTSTGTTTSQAIYSSSLVKSATSATFSSNQSVTNGTVGSVIITNGGSGYTDGPYNGTATTGGSGTDLSLDIIVSGGVVISAIPRPGSRGTGYIQGAIVNASIPGGTGFAASVNLRSEAFSAYDNIDKFIVAGGGDNYYGFKNNPTINQTSTAIGSIYGFYHNPTLTSLKGQNIAWQNVTGDVYLCSTSGNVGIGTTSPGTYKLSVEGTIGARRVKVIAPGAPWADYVFDSSYQLPSLQEVEHFIQRNKHLPEVPSAAEVKMNGIDLGDNQVTLLKKIEELTLYIITQEKQLDRQKQELDTQKQQNVTLENRLAAIEVMLKALKK